MKTSRFFLPLALLLAAGYGAFAWHQHGQPAAPVAQRKLQYQCPMHPQIVRDAPGDCPICHMHLQLVEQETSAEPIARAPEHKIVKYRNPMDPKVFSDKPMKDPMGMDYVPVYADEMEGAPTRLKAEHKIVKYRNPMDPKVFSDKPMKDPMGMDYVPVYADEMDDSPAAEAVPDHAGFKLSAERQQLIGVRSEAAQVRTVVRTLRLPGRVGEDPGTVLAQALEMDGAVLKSGQEAQVWVTNEGARRARVVAVDRSLDSFSRTFGVRLALQELAGPGFRPGVYCDVRVQLRLTQGVTVPKEALLDTGDRQVLFVQHDGGHFEPRVVEVGKVGDDFIEIRKGVAAGEQVVTAANFLIDSESRFQAAARDFGGGHD